MTVLVLFDVDGTLTLPRKKIQHDMLEKLKQLSSLNNVDIGIVGGSNLEKQKEQIGDENFNMFKWIFAENGLQAFCDGKEIHLQNLVTKLGQTNYTKLINICLNELSQIDNPIKTGTFIEYRNGMINVSPIGRNCTQEQRDAFYAKDKIYNWRKKLIQRIKDKWENYKWFENVSNIPELTFSIGGQISFDVFPLGWDKTYCLQFVKEKYEKIYFFGDKTMEGGNDYEIYNHLDTSGYSVTSPQDTIKFINKIFL